VVKITPNFSFARRVIGLPRGWTIVCSKETQRWWGRRLGRKKRVSRSLRFCFLSLSLDHLALHSVPYLMTAYDGKGSNSSQVRTLDIFINYEEFPIRTLILHELLRCDRRRTHPVSQFEDLPCHPIVARSTAQNWTCNPRRERIFATTDI